MAGGGSLRSSQWLSCPELKGGELVCRAEKAASQQPLPGFFPMQSQRDPWVGDSWVLWSLFSTTGDGV